MPSKLQANTRALFCLQGATLFGTEDAESFTKENYGMILTVFLCTALFYLMKLDHSGIDFAKYVTTV